jgi:hypothetical protein
MCRERTISFPWPSLARGANHGQPDIQESHAEEIDIGDVVRANLFWLSQVRGLSLPSPAARPSELEDLATG